MILPLYSTYTFIPGMFSERSIASVHRESLSGDVARVIASQGGDGRSQFLRQSVAAQFAACAEFRFLVIDARVLKQLARHPGFDEARAYGIDDRTSLGALHRASDMLGKDNGAVEIDGHHRVPLVQVLVGGETLVVAGDAGVVAQYVDMSVPRDHIRDATLDGRFVRDINNATYGAGGIRQRGGEVAQRVCVAVD